MGIKDWLQRKGEEKSASNIIDGLRRLVTAVRTDINETTNELAGRTVAMDAMVDGTQPWEADTFAQFEQDRKRWSSRKEKVVEAQKKLFDDLALWNSLPVERTVNEIVFPALISGSLVALSEQSYGAVVVAAYRVCEAVARQKGVSLEAHTPHAILQMVNDAGDPHIARFTPSRPTYSETPKSPAVDAEQEMGKESFEKKDYTRAAFLLRNRFGDSSVVDALRLDILMDYWIRFGKGTAAIRWTAPGVDSTPIQETLIALLYGRILCIHKETREELFSRVGDLAIQNVKSEGATGFEFAPWVLHVGFGGGDHRLWPWRIVPPAHVTSPKIYSAFLKVGKPTSIAPSGRSIHLDMAMGLARVLAPSSALIAIAGFSRACDKDARYLLALRLWQMNAYWGSPDRVSVGSEASAYAAADSAIRSGQLRIW
ncbi:MAG: hypothetical protein HYS65_14425 [Betaproteobacteria bacterium]|nr:hypothetical protein [Betaproteobacteria bacterium]